MNTINQYRYNTCLYIPKTSKQSHIQPNSNVVSFGNLRHLPTKTIPPTQGKSPVIKTKLADLFERISIFAFKLSEKLLKKDAVTDSQKILEQQTIIRTLTKSMNKARQEFEATLSDYETGKINPVLRAKIHDEVFNEKLNYDYMTPFFEPEKPLYPPERYEYVYEEIKTGTTNRADMQELVIPKISLMGDFDFELPQGEMKIKKAKLKELKESFEIQSNISDKYSESLIWNTDKIVRDLLQNFFDGHGQTLDGVRFLFTPAGLGKYKVRIEGKSTYPFKEAVLLGESQSHNDNKAAGNYGEGLKMVTLKLLMQNKTSNVKIGSGNWEVVCNLKKDERLDSELMHYKISPAENYDGNYIEFETSDKKLLETIRIFINRFYHSSNPHFKAPDFENELFGIKILPKGEKGGLYINGQRFEYQNNYDGIDRGVLFIKEKVPTECYDVSRDRVSITKDNFRDIVKWLEERTRTYAEFRQIIKVLEPFINEDNQPLEDLLDHFVSQLGYKIKYHKVGAIKFPDKYIAKTTWSLDWDIAHSLRENGYKIFPYGYADLGMNSVANIIKKAREHESLQPTDKDIIKIVIIKRALKLLSHLKEKHFSDKELDTKIYIFDGKSKKENAIDSYKDVQAEAIIDYDKDISKGFWIDKTYLGKAKFAHVLETALHELSHKVGGDGTTKFGYKLTNVNQEVLLQIVQNPKVAEELRILNDIWEKL